VARLALYDDSGNEVMTADVPTASFAWLAQFIRLHGGSIRAVTAAIRAGQALLAAAPPPVATRPRPPRSISPVYSPPKRDRR
jgi:hypothetical protein